MLKLKNCVFWLLYFIPFLLFLDEWLFGAFSIEDVDEEDDELVEGDERDDMAEERLVGETDDFFWWSLWWCETGWLPLLLPRTWFEGAFALFSFPTVKKIRNWWNVKQYWTWLNE